MNTDGHGWPMRLACGAVLLALCAAGQETHVTKSGLAVTDLTVCPMALWQHGMIERRFLIDNRLPERRTVTLELPADPEVGRWDQRLGSLSGTVTVEAGGKATLALLQPPLEFGYGKASFAVRERGRRRETFELAVPSGWLSSGNMRRDANCVSILLPKKVSAEQTEARLNAATNTLVAGVAITRTDLEAGGWPENWLAYTAFDGCLLDAETAARLTDGARAALRDYAAAGGTVTLLGQAGLPDEWRAGGGAGGQQTVEGFSECLCGVGAVQAVAADAASLTRAQAAAMLTAYAGMRGATRNWGGSGGWSIETCLREIPVSGGVDVPVKTFLATLLLFVLVAGPGAVILTARLNRRIWLLAVVPAVSVAFGAAVFVFAVCAEGVRPSVRRQAVTLLDQTQKRAVTLGAVSVYAPMSLAGGVSFDRGTEVMPVLYGGKGAFTRIVDDDAQRFCEGWVQPRMAAFFRLRRSESRSERLVVTEREDGTVEVVNGLGAPIRKLALNDGRGNLYEEADIAPGEKRACARAASPDAGKLPVSARYPEAAVKVVYKTAANHPGWDIAEWVDGKKALPRPSKRVYTALLDGCPFLEQPVPGRAVKETARAVVVGRF